MRFYKLPNPHGHIDRQGKLVKRGKQVVLFKIYDGFGVPVRVLDQIRSIEVHYQNEAYSASVDMFRQHGIAHTFENEKQLILPRKYWIVASQEKLL